ncbi:MAG: carbohydrate ABC transporter permease [Eubacteriales bacterium]|nr:carbohydrate ABC transporter permease [Clostridiales bacterium]MDY2770649.1 carbohydrate ABC transporter permease [Eubacteriales bacterium]
MERRIGRCRSDVIYDTILFILLSLVFLVVAYPLYFVIISSVSDPIAVSNGEVTFYPIGFTLDGYREVFKTNTVVRGFLNSLLYTVCGVSVNLLVTLPTGYALSRKDFALKKFVTFFYMLTMFIGGGMMPTYLIVKQTGLLNSMWALIIPGAMGVYNMIVAKTFFSTNIPLELMEAARLDGCGNTRFFFHIVLPLSGAITAILVLYYGQGHWNSYFSALLYINDREKWPLQLELRNILLLNTNTMTKEFITEEMRKEQARREALANMMKYSLIIISSIPMLIVYPFVQKHFVKGVMIGSVKG